MPSNLPNSNRLANSQIQRPRRSSATSRNLWRNARAMGDVKYIFLTWTIFTVLYMLFIYYVLIAGKVQVGAVFFGASTTNLLVSIFSQIFVVLATMTIHGLFKALRLVLKDVSLVTFFGISPSSGWSSVLKLLSSGWFPNLRRNFTFRILGEGSLLLAILALPIVGLAFGSVLKYHAEFEYYFVPGPTKVPVFAGLIPLDNQILDLIPTATLCTYVEGWTSSLLTNNKYATSFQIDGCNGGCRPVFLPGGIELARQVGPWLNQSMFEGGLLDNAETIRINNAPGIVTTFRNISDIILDPADSAVDCLYAGQSINDSLQMCIRQVNHSIAVGWASCPQELYDNNSCNSNLNWTTAPLKWATILTAYKQYATTAYNRQNFSIVDVRPTANLEQMPLNASDYMTIFNKILIPTNTSSVADNASINALTYTLTWLHRTYLGSFPDDQNSLVTNLHNFLAIPLQFTVTAVQYANYSSNLNFSLPNDTMTVATDGWSKSRLAIQPWTGWLFIGAAAVLLLAVMASLLWILARKDPLTPTTGIGDLDYLRPAENIEVTKGTGREREQKTLRDFAKDTEMYSARGVAKEMGDWKVVG